MESAYLKRAKLNGAIETAVYVFLLLNLAVIGYFWWHNSGSEVLHSPAGWARGLGRLFGLLAAFSIILDFVLIARIPLLERVFGRAKQTQWHKWAGYAAFLLIIAHFSFLIGGYGVVDHLGIWPQFWSFATTYQDVIKAVYAFLILIAVVGLSVYFVRRQVKYETWYFVHLLSYLVIILAFNHQLNVGPDFLTQPLFRIYWWGLYIGLFILVVGFRFVKPILQSLFYGLVVDRVVPENHDTFSVYVKGRNLQSLNYEAGQFAIWWFIDPLRFWQGHAFSLTSQPGSDRLRFTFKQSGDYTNLLSRLKPGTPAVMDGPYGRFTTSASNQQKVLLIAGGIGVTPLYAMLGPLLNQGRDVVLVYSVKTTADIAFGAELNQLAKAHQIKVQYILTQDQSDRAKSGMLDQAKLAQLVPDANQRVVYLCGPPAMMAALSQALEQLGTPKTKIHTENFSF